jgi:muconolactone delta-isomerase
MALDEAFFDEMARTCNELMLSEARAGKDQDVQFVGGVFRTVDGEERILFAYEEYRDDEHVSLCTETIEDYRKLLRAGESIRMAIWRVDMEKVRPFDMPEESHHRLRRENGVLFDLRGSIHFHVLWLIVGTEKRIALYVVDHGDRASLNETMAQTTGSIERLGLLRPNEAMAVVSYEAPRSALTELS